MDFQGIQGKECMQGKKCSSTYSKRLENWCLAQVSLKGFPSARLKLHMTPRLKGKTSSVQRQQIVGSKAITCRLSLVSSVAMSRNRN